MGGLSFPVARINIQDVDLVVVFVDDAWQDKHEIYAALNPSAGNNVVLVWQDQFGRTRFIAPPEQHPFLQIVGYDQLLAQVNSKLDFGGIAAPPPPGPS
jgi:hypothetical protein